MGTSVVCSGQQFGQLRAISIEMNPPSIMQARECSRTS